MWVETRIHLTLTAMQARDFAIPLCSTWHLHTASDSGVEGKKKVLGDEEEATKNWAYTEGGLWRIQQMGAKKKVSMSCQIELITWIFFKPSQFFLALKNWWLKYWAKINFEKMSSSKWIY